MILIIAEETLEYEVTIGEEIMCLFNFWEHFLEFDPTLHPSCWSANNVKCNEYLIKKPFLNRTRVPTWNYLFSSATATQIQQTDRTEFNPNDLSKYKFKSCTMIINRLNLIAAHDMIVFCNWTLELVYMT